MLEELFLLGLVEIRLLRIHEGLQLLLCHSQNLQQRVQKSLQLFLIFAQKMFLKLILKRLEVLASLSVELLDALPADSPAELLNRLDLILLERVKEFIDDVF